MSLGYLNNNKKAAWQFDQIKLQLFIVVYMTTFSLKEG